MILLFIEIPFTERANETVEKLPLRRLTSAKWAWTIETCPVFGLGNRNSGHFEPEVVGYFLHFSAKAFSTISTRLSEKASLRGLTCAKWAGTIEKYPGFGSGNRPTDAGLAAFNISHNPLRIKSHYNEGI
jgi:hypothetical protein